MSETPANSTPPRPPAAPWPVPDPPRPVIKPPKPTPPKDWGAGSRACAAKFDAEAREELARRLGLPATAFAALPLIGVSARTKAGRTFTFPECDATGRVIGVTERIPQADGTEQKKMRAGGKRELTIPDGWCAGSGPLLLVEGPSDVLALAAAGLAAVGRPSNTGGVAHLVGLLADWPRDRAAIVVGENDRRDDQWPGRDGAQRTAAALQALLGRVVTVAMPPGDAKDVRAWLTGRAADGADWAVLGRELLAHLTGTAAPVEGRRRTSSRTAAACSTS